jgi:xylulokinase
MSELILGIDIGTSASKVALFNTEGKVVAQNSGAYDTYYPHKGWAEQNPEDWWKAICTATKEMIEQNNINSADILAVGIDGQSWSAIPVDMNGNVLCNTPIWMDTRAADICEEIKKEIDDKAIFELCGNSLQPSYTLPKILWYKKYRKNNYYKAVKILQSNGFIAYKLTGKFSQDKSQGYGYACFDMRRETWDYDMCEALGVEKYLLPDIFECHDVVGGVTKRAAEQIGLKEGTPVVAGGLDAACGALGAGVLDGGQTQEQGGQAGGMSICLETYNADPSLILSPHVVPKRWLLQGGTVGGGGIIRWFEREFGAAERITAEKNHTHSMAEMDKLAATIDPCCNGLIFLPYMQGERSPIWNPNAKGVYYGLDYSKTRAHMIRATLEASAYALKHNLDVAERAGAKVDELYAIGGSANSDIWLQIKADVTGKKILVPYSDNASTLGAVMLAGVGTGIYKDFNEAVAKTVHMRKEVNPNKDNYDKYQKNYKMYLELYERLKDMMNTYADN